MCTCFTYQEIPAYFDNDFSKIENKISNELGKGIFLLLEIWIVKVPNTIIDSV